MHFQFLSQVDDAGDADGLNQAVSVHHDIIPGISFSGMKVKGKQIFQIGMETGLFPGPEPLFPPVADLGIVQRGRGPNMAFPDIERFRMAQDSIPAQFPKDIPTGEDQGKGLNALQMIFRKRIGNIGRFQKLQQNDTPAHPVRQFPLVAFKCAVEEAKRHTFFIGCNPGSSSPPVFREYDLFAVSCGLHQAFGCPGRRFVPVGIQIKSAPGSGDIGNGTHVV